MQWKQPPKVMFGYTKASPSDYIAVAWAKVWAQFPNVAPLKQGYLNGGTKL